MAEEKDVKIGSSDSEDIKEGPKVMSKINLGDGQHINPKFEISVGEIKNLPADYEKSPGIVNAIKVGDLILMDKPSGEKKEEGATLDTKDVGNFLNQNTSVVLKQLKVNDLSNKDLQKLLIAERKGKQRKKIMDFIKSLKGVV